MGSEMCIRDSAETINEAFDDGNSGIDIRLAQGTSAADARRIKRELRLRKIGRRPPVHDVEAEPVDPIVAAAAAAGEAAGRETSGAEAPADQPPPAPKRLGGYAVMNRVNENANAGTSNIKTRKTPSSSVCVA